MSGATALSLAAGALIGALLATAVSRSERWGGFYVERDVGEAVGLLFDRVRTEHEERSAFHDIRVLGHPTFGKILVMDSDLMLTERDHHRYHEMMVHVPMAYRPTDVGLRVRGAPRSLGALPRRALIRAARAPGACDWRRRRRRRVRAAQILSRRAHHDRGHRRAGLRCGSSAFPCAGRVPGQPEGAGELSVCKFARSPGRAL